MQLWLLLSSVPAERRNFTICAFLMLPWRRRSSMWNWGNQRTKYHVHFALKVIIENSSLIISTFVRKMQLGKTSFSGIGTAAALGKWWAKINWDPCLPKSPSFSSYQTRRSTPATASGDLRALHFATLERTFASEVGIPILSLNLTSRIRSEISANEEIGSTKLCHHQASLQLQLKIWKMRYRWKFKMTSGRATHWRIINFDLENSFETVSFCKC